MKALVLATIIVLAVSPAFAEQDLHFRAPQPVSSVPFTGLLPGKTVSLQACAKKTLLDQLNLWPGAPVMVEYTWKKTGTPLSYAPWPGQKEALPLKRQLVIWLDNNTEFCTAGESLKSENFPDTGMWDVTVSMHAPVKKYGSNTMLIGGELARIRVDPPKVTVKPSATMKATPVPVPPAGGQGGAGRGANDTMADALAHKLGRVTERIKTLERGARCTECGDFTRRADAIRRQIVPGLPPARTQQLTLEADRLGGDVARVEASRRLPAVQGARPGAPTRDQPSAPSR